jgi:hypothetical protein
MDDVIIEFTGSAFRHGFTKEDILHALKMNVSAAAIDTLPEKYAHIGLDRGLNSLEIIYNQIDDNTIQIFHAMRLRDSFVAKYGLQERTMGQRLTEEEAWALDDYVTRNDLELGPEGSDFLSRREARLAAYEMGLDKAAVTWLCAKAELTHQSVGAVINALVRKELAASA